MKKITTLFCILIIALTLVSCVQFEEPADRTNFVLVSDPDNPGSICFTIEGADSFEWYEADDPINCIGTGNTLNIAAFEDAELREYYCLAKKNGIQVARSMQYYVAFTKLPIVTITTDTGDDVTSKRNYVSATLKIINGDKYVKDLDSVTVQVKGRGASSWYFMENKSYNLKFDKKQKVLKNASKSKRWCMTANYLDNSEMGNWMASYVGRNFFNSVWEPEFQYVNLILNGEYKGLYLIGETVKVDEDRIDVQDISDMTENPVDYNKNGYIDFEDGGYILEITTESADSSFCTLHGLGITFKDPDLEEIASELTRKEIIESARKKVNRLEAAIMGDSDEDFTDLMDLDSMVDWFLANIYVNNNEANFKTSCYFYYDPAEGKFFMGPNWDFDRSLTNRDPSQIQVLTKHNYWYQSLMSNKVFSDAVKTKWNSFVDNNHQMVLDEAKAIAGRIRVALEMDSVRWDKEIVSVDAVYEWFAKHATYLSNTFSRY